MDDHTCGHLLARFKSEVLVPASIDRLPIERTLGDYKHRETAAPDGYSKPSILINGQFPGPLIEANWGDEIAGKLLTVHNRIEEPKEGTAIHWHGQLQRGTPWMDGVPGVTQCPIAPGSDFTCVDLLPR
ncbi:MAG: hypothetical protein Q9163_003422 [Psora crenata]